MWGHECLCILHMKYSHRATVCRLNSHRAFQQGSKAPLCLPMPLCFAGESTPFLPMEGDRTFPDQSHCRKLWQIRKAFLGASLTTQNSIAEGHQRQTSRLESLFEVWAQCTRPWTKEKERCWQDIGPYLPIGCREQDPWPSRRLWERMETIRRHLGKKAC